MCKSIVFVHISSSHRNFSVFSRTLHVFRESNRNRRLKKKKTLDERSGCIPCIPYTAIPCRPRQLSSIPDVSAFNDRLCFFGSHAFNATAERKCRVGRETEGISEKRRKAGACSRGTRGTIAHGRNNAAERRFPESLSAETNYTRNRLLIIPLCCTPSAAVAVDRMRIYDRRLNRSYRIYVRYRYARGS